MSNALKCDRCKNYFDYNPEAKFNFIAFGHKDIIIGKNFPVKDICPDCMEQFMTWFENPDVNETDCTDRSNGATEKELEAELGYTMSKEEIELNPKLNEYGCPHNKCWDCLYFSKELNQFNIHDHNGIYKCNFKNVYISGNCSRPNVSDMTPKDFCNLGCNFVKETTKEPEYKDPCESCHNGKCEQCIYGYCSEEEQKRRWLENHKKEE